MAAWDIDVCHVPSPVTTEPVNTVCQSKLKHLQYTGNASLRTLYTCVATFGSYNILLDMSCMNVWNVMCVSVLVSTTHAAPTMQAQAHLLKITLTPWLADLVQHLQIGPCFGDMSNDRMHRSTVQKVPPRFLVPNEWKCLLASSCLPSLLTIAIVKITFVCCQLPKGARSNGRGHACGTGGTDRACT